ncbi:hypothetical protein ACVILI_004351 [Mesorhizobium sp. USDA 4775]|nr:hypothetical protein [Mesorhizobium jarvisii]
MTAEAKKQRSSTCGFDWRELKPIRNVEGGQNDENSREVKEGG